MRSLAIQIKTLQVYLTHGCRCQLHNHRRLQRKRIILGYDTSIPLHQAKNAMHMENSVIFEVTNVCSNGPFAAVDKIHARCDMNTDGGGWMVIQRRVANRTENFNRPWEDYEEGFGSLDGEFWYGLRNIHCLASREDVELRIDIKYSNGTDEAWTYQLFQVAGPEDKYHLQIGSGEGAAYDSLAYLNGSQFSTHDQDNDRNAGLHCASTFHGGWWHNDCFFSHLNGPNIQWFDGRRTHYVPYIRGSWPRSSH